MHDFDCLRDAQADLRCAIAENLRDPCPVRFGDFPRPIELRAKATFEPEQLRTLRFKVGSQLIRLGVRVLGWRADYYLWDSRGPSMAAPHPCPCHYTRRVEEGGS